MAATLSRRAAEAEPRHDDAGRRLPVAGNRPWRPLESDAAPINDLGRGVRNGREGRAAAGAKDQPGSRLVREWHGRTHTVCVIDDGFEFQGETYRSLTGIARDIARAQWSGPRFFGLTKRAATPRATPDNPLTGAQIVSENADG